MRIFHRRTPETQDALEILALAMEYICQERDQQGDATGWRSEAIQMLLAAQLHLSLGR